MPVATDIAYVRQTKILTVTFDDGRAFDLSAEYLRVESPSAEVQGHSPDEKRLVAGKRHVAILGIEPVGNYAIRIIFDDGHDSGFYTWNELYRLGDDMRQIWSSYQAQLLLAGLERE